MDNYILAYYQQIKDGSVVVGKWVAMLYEMIVAGIENGTYMFNQQKANRAIRFIETFCRHNKGKLAPGLLKLSLWQKAFYSILYGITDKKGKRQFKEVALFVGRKCGKTLMASAVISYETYVDGEFGSEIYCVAPKLDQSDLVFSAFEFTKDHTPEFKKRTRKRKTDYIIDANNTTIKKIAFNEKKADGYSPMLTVADEMSSWPAARGLRQYEVMVSGTGARQEPITLSISSGGYVNGGVYDELFARGTRVLKGDSTETHLLPVFYIIDDPEKWDDINELRKSLPGMGVSVPVQFIIDEIDIARSSLSKKNEFLTKYCCLKQNSSEAWLNTRDIMACFQEEPLKFEDFNRCYCVGGIDLSQTTDLTAAVCVIEKNETLHVFAHFWLPANKLEDAIAKDNLPYEIYIKKGWLSLSGENFVDYHDCQQWFEDLLDKQKIYPQQIGYDRYSSQYLVQEMKQTFEMDDVYQGTNLTPVIREVEGLIRDGRFNFGNNELMKIHLLNSALKIETEQNKVRLVKISPKEHIDGTAALLDAMCVRQKWWSEIGLRLQNKDRK